MTTPAPTDLFAVQRGSTHHHVPFSALGTVADTDLFVVQRGTTHHKVTGAEVKAWLAAP